MKTDEIAPLNNLSSNVNRQTEIYQKRHEHPTNQMTVTAQETLKFRRQNFLSDANRALAMVHRQ